MWLKSQPEQGCELDGKFSVSQTVTKLFSFIYDRFSQPLDIDILGWIILCRLAVQCIGKVLVASVTIPTGCQTSLLDYAIKIVQAFGT